MVQRAFAEKARQILEPDENVIGLAVGGSWLTDDMDEFSDLDLIRVTRQKISSDKQRMLEYAARLGDLLSGFTGEHVGEPSVLICLYDHRLLHVDIKFVTVEEFHSRIETPVLLIDKDTNNWRKPSSIHRQNTLFPITSGWKTGSGSGFIMHCSKLAGENILRLSIL